MDTPTPTPLDAKETASVVVEVVESPEQAAARQAALVADTMSLYEKRRALRRPFEIQWFINASALRGFPDVRFNVELARLEVKKEPAHRKRFRINLIKPKYVARVAKYTRIPPNPTVIPATTDREDLLNAKASQKGLEYYTRKSALRAKWVQAMQWVPITGKAFWAIRWNDDVVAHAPTKLDGKLRPILGEVETEFCSAFEILPADPGIELMANQPEIMRVRLVPTNEIEQRFSLDAGSIAPENNDVDLFFYQRQIADLGSRYQGVSSRSDNLGTTDKYALLIERFIAPCPEYPKGRYLVVAGNKLLKESDTLPGNFQYASRNPYPFVEMCDDAAPGQFWPDAFVERLIGLQSEYNEYRSKLGENLAMHFFPKLVVPNQLGLSSDSYNSEAGERLNINWIPGIPLPTFLQPSSVVGDAWNIIQMIKKEMDDVTLIYPSTLGGAGGSNSGFQTNLLQEAADQVHGPAIQRNAMALEEAFLKIRHLMKQFYTIPRMVSIAGKSNIPEVAEFSRESIDEHADIRIEPDTMMPQLRSARVDQIRQMFTEGMFGAPNDPKTQRRAQDMLRLSFSDFEIERDQRDQEQAQLENILMTEGKWRLLHKPQPFENHQVHWEAHIDLFKSAEARSWSFEQRIINIFHALVHLCYIDPEQAKMMSREYGLEYAISEILSVILGKPAPEIEPAPESHEPPLTTIPDPALPPDSVESPDSDELFEDDDDNEFDILENLPEPPKPQIVVQNTTKLPVGYRIKRHPETGLLEGIEPLLSGMGDEA